MSCLDKIVDPEKVAREERALEVFKELAKDCDADMIPKFVKYRDDLYKATFYFLCDHRVDFRELVKQLSQKLSISVEMRQINEREQAMMIGGLGPCGQELCCCKFGRSCCKKNATIKMAKNQDLSLNPTKISGMCGRLMCCLRFENDYYKDFKARAPKINSFVKTPEGDAKVIGHDAMREVVKLRVGEDKPRSIKLKDFEDVSNKDDGFVVGELVWQEATNALNDIRKSAANVTIDTSVFTGTDRVANARNVKLAEKPKAARQGVELKRRRKDKKPRRISKAGSLLRSPATATRPGGNSSATNLKGSNEVRSISRPSRDNKKGAKLRKRRTTKISSSK